LAELGSKHNDMCGEWFGCQSYGTLGNTEMKLFLKIGNVTC